MATSFRVPVSKSTGEVCPAGVHIAIPVGIIDLGTQTIDWQGKSKNVPKVQVVFELPKVRRQEGDWAGEPFMLRKTYTNVLNEKSNLMKDLVSWRGRKFTDAELERFDLAKLLGVPCQVQVIHDERQGKTYANIANIMGVPEGTDVPAAETKRYIFSLSEFDQAMFDSFHDKLKEAIARSPEYKAAVSSKPKSDADESGTATVDDFSDDVPF